MIRKSILLIFTISLVVSCGVPNDPADYTGGYEIVKKLTTPGAANDIVISGDYAYLAQGEGGLLIVDISQPASPTVKTMLNDNVRGYSSTITKRNDKVYLTAGSYGVTVADVSDPANPEVVVSNLAIKPAKNVSILGDYLLTSIGERGFKLAFLGDGNIPDIRGETNTNGYARVAIPDNSLTRILVTTGEVGFEIFDISDFQDGYGIYPRLGTCDLPGIAEGIALHNTEALAYIACGRAGLAIVDYSDEQHPNVIGTFDTGGYAKEVIYDNGKVYVTAEQGGLHIIDVHNGTDPKEIGIVDTEKAMGIGMKDNYLFVTDVIEGLIVIKKP